MSTLVAVKRHMATMGILPIPKENLPFLVRSYQIAINRLHITFMTLNLGIYASSVLYFVIFEAKIFSEFSDGLLFCALNFLHTTLYYNLNKQKRNISKLMDDLDNVIKTSRAFVMFLKIKYYSFDILAFKFFCQFWF